MKKFLSFLLTFVMLFSLSMPAMAAEITGNTEGEVSGNFNPDIKFTGITVTAEFEEIYDESTGNYIAVIIPGETRTDVTFTLTGENLNYLTADNEMLMVKANDSVFGEGEMYLDALIAENFSASIYNWEDGDWFEYSYSNDGGTTWSTVRVDMKQAYSIAVNASENGIVTAKEYALPGDTVTLNVSPAENYALDGITVTDASGNPVTVENNQFTMPASAVTVSATFEYAPKYNITVNTPENGSVSADMQTATEGTTVTLTATPADGYQLGKLTVTNVATSDVTDITESKSFVMPGAEVSITAVFEKLPRTITIDSAITNGTVTADKTTAVEGDTVTLTVDPANGYQIDNVTVTDAEGNTVDFTETGVASGTYRFTMPASNITVTATFTELPVTSVAITWGSMSFTYSDEQVTQEDGSTADEGWTDSGTGWVTVKNTGETTFTAKAEYVSYEGYESITGSFNPASKELAPPSGEQEGEEYTFTLVLSGKPTKALSGEKIGKVTITINEAAEG